METNRLPLYLDVTKDVVENSVKRAREQEKIYGHNTGHFTLKVEKENTVIGVIGESLVRQALLKIANSKSILIQIDHTDLGAPLDLELKEPRGGKLLGLHVKTGLWSRWPAEGFEFGVHADQKIESSNSPLVLVSLLKDPGGYPKKARIEGFIKSDDLRHSTLIKKGARFPATGVISRTDNLITKFSQYGDVTSIFEVLFG